MTTACRVDHLNGFEHLDVEIESGDRALDLGYRFGEAEDGPSQGVDSTTGVELWGDPFLPLFVSVHEVTPGGHAYHGPLHYGLSRSRWTDITEPGLADRDALLNEARGQLASDIDESLAGRSPAAAQATVIFG